MNEPIVQSIAQLADAEDEILDDLFARAACATTSG